MNKAFSRFLYWRRIFSAYVTGGTSHLSFWHEIPESSGVKDFSVLGPYYMTFHGKASYSGPFDINGIPLLDYRGHIGKQYNPIAIAQYGLANYNRYKMHGESRCRDIFINQADWLSGKQELNDRGVPVWMHHFDWEYREKLKAPWYSALAQGSGLSLLSRAYAETAKQVYMEAAKKAFFSLQTDVLDGGVLYRDDIGMIWLEESIVAPPTHILNGFIWALWGVHDYYIVSRDPRAKEIYAQAVQTLTAHVRDYDTGFWSLYELSGTFMPMLASGYYHALHIVQLEILRDMTGIEAFGLIADKWRSYSRRAFNRWLAFVGKVIFKLLYY